MHIHLPKPVHGWRELLGEIGVIAIGILIALGAEQGAEAIHHRLQVREMTAKLRGESIENRHVVEFDISSLTQASQELDRGIAALNGCSSAPVDLRVPARPFVLVPSDAAWIGIRDSALLPLMEERLTANYWKIDTVGRAIATASDHMVGDFNRAAAAVDSVRVVPADRAICGEALLALNGAKQQYGTLVALAVIFRDANEQALRGERIDYATHH